ncbi:histidine kinase dimerization/phospho-acceptor domain-containing protein [Rubricoccus marinus]|uniref:histidine kinase n=1 Tax=Rubricoccus marinus TaxID=716817 RepID=A0A259TVZ9_9BACT|nr:histidine kinase dimerization/phospho-acceptor domain-containing protein [Rubricoccus marinus]OZC01913.1 hypothetical protein BSZ36_02265 [Rubricoccus marinus]
MASFALLLIDRDAAPLAEALQRDVPGLSVTPCTSLVAARAHLVGSRFGAILAEYDLPDGPALSLLELPVTIPPLWVRAGSALRAEEALRDGAVGFVAGPDARALGPFVAWHAGLSELVAPLAESEGADEAGGDEGASDEQMPEATALYLERVRGELGRITHALNNPLAVISGNVQLARELIVAAPEDPMVSSSLEDIQTAAKELGALIEDINELRRSLAPPPPELG